MRISLRYMCIWMIAAAGVFSLSAQELNATVKVHSNLIPGTHRQLFASLEEALHTFINGRRWSDLPGRSNEKIDCTFTLMITEALSPGSFRGELYVQSRVPVHNATLETPLLNIRDKQFAFDYAAYQPLSFDPHFVQDNLTATVAFYVYLILGLAGDADAPLGGTPSFRAMEEIAASVQSYGWRGWETDRHSRSRTVMAAAFNNGSGEGFRKMWYNYHALGLNLLSTNASRGLENVAASVPLISSLHAEQPGSVLIQMFGDAKLEELSQLLSNGSTEKKRDAYQSLREIYPTRGTVLDKLR
ncbi:MAG: DUF4835 family protein [Proteiniphilum sp.]